MLKCTARCPLVMTSCKERDTTFINVYTNRAPREYEKFSRKWPTNRWFDRPKLLSDSGKWRDNDSRGCWTDKKNDAPTRLFFEKSLSLSLLPGPFRVVCSQNAPHTSMRVCHGVMYLPSRYFFPLLCFFFNEKSAQTGYLPVKLFYLLRARNEEGRKESALGDIERNSRPNKILLLYLLTVTPLWVISRIVHPGASKRSSPTISRQWKRGIRVRERR